MPVVAVGAVAIIALALLALLIVFAGELLAKLVANIVSRLPLGIGDFLSGPVNTMARAVVDATQAISNQYLSPITRFFHGIAVHLYGMWDASAEFAREIATTLDRLFTHTLPATITRAYTLAVDWAWPRIEAVLHTAQALVSAAEVRLSAAIHAVQVRISTAEAEIAHDLAVVDTKIATTAADLARDIDHAEAAAIATATALTNGVRVDMTRAIQLAETQAANGLTATTQALTGLIGATATDLTDLAKGADAELAAGIDHAASVVAEAAWPTITDLVDGIKAKVAGLDRPIEGIIDGIPAAVPVTLEGTLAATMALAEAATTYVDECGIDLCRNLGGLGNFLAGLANDLETGALFALLALMISDPEAGASAVRVTLGPPAAAVAGTARGIFG